MDVFEWSLVIRLLVWIWSYFLFNFTKYKRVTKSLLQLLFLVTLFVVYFLAYGDGTTSKWSAGGRAVLAVLLSIPLVVIAYWIGYLLTKLMVYLVKLVDKEKSN